MFLACFMKSLCAARGLAVDARWAGPRRRHAPERMRRQTTQRKRAVSGDLT